MRPIIYMDDIAIYKEIYNLSGDSRRFLSLFAEMIGTRDGRAHTLLQYELMFRFVNEMSSLRLDDVFYRASSRMRAYLFGDVMSNIRRLQATHKLYIIPVTFDFGI